MSGSGRHSGSAKIEVEVIQVDGSFGEGGGQIIRNAVTLTCLLRRRVEVIKIRAGRPNPGLASQHLESILALLRLTSATSTAKFAKGLTEFNIDATEVPKPSGRVTTTIDLKTAGSINLCIQCILPFLLSLPAPSAVAILGGTHVMKAPNVDYMDRVFLPILRRTVGYDVDLQMRRPGYFPRGGGRVELKVNPGTGTFNTFSLTKRGRLLEKTAILNLTRDLYAQRNSITKRLTLDPSVEVRSVSYSSVEYFLKFENSAAGFYYLLPRQSGSQQHRAEDELLEAIARVEAEVTAFLDAPDAAVDSFMQDQLILYMALAKVQQGQSDQQVSQFRTLGPLTDHTLSAIHVAEEFMGFKFNIDSEKGDIFMISL